MAWRDSKAEGTAKPMGEEVCWRLSVAARNAATPYVPPLSLHPGQHLTDDEYYNDWTCTLKAAGVTYVATHATRPRSATDTANSGIPLTVGLALTANKTLATCMRCVQSEEEPAREAAELVANRRKAITGLTRAAEETA